MLTFTTATALTVHADAILAAADVQAAATARQHADAAASTLAVARTVADLLPATFRTPGGADAAYTVALIAEHADDAERAAAHVETGTREYAEQFDHLASSAKFDARMAASMLDYLTAGLVAYDTAA